MDKILINPLSASSVFIEMLYDDVVLACGTAFYYKYNTRLYLVSNWHNFSGRDPGSKKPLRDDVAIPNRIRVHAHNANKLGSPDVLFYQLSSGCSWLWYEHPIHGSCVDVGVLPVGDLDGQSCRIDITSAIEKIDRYSKWPLEPGESLFVLGFPFGISAGGCFPVWKSASLASEPMLDLKGLPLLYVDTASRSGMSGSPVIQHVRRPVTLSGENEGVSRFRADFIGIYSGRIVAKDALEAQLGLVWKAKCIEEIIKSAKFAAF